MGVGVHPAGLRWDSATWDGRLCALAREPRATSMGGDRISTRRDPTLRDNPFLDFHRRAEAAGYPALLIVSVVSLALVVTPVLLLGLTRAVWVLALALLNLLLAMALLAGAVLAAMSDYG